MVWGLGLELRVQGSGFRVQGSGFRVQGSGFRVQGSGPRVQGSGFRVQGPGSRVEHHAHTAQLCPEERASIHRRARRHCRVHHFSRGSGGGRAV